MMPRTVFGIFDPPKWRNLYQGLVGRASIAPGQLAVNADPACCIRGSRRCRLLRRLRRRREGRSMGRAEGFIKATILRQAGKGLSPGLAGALRLVYGASFLGFVERSAGLWRGARWVVRGGVN